MLHKALLFYGSTAVFVSVYRGDRPGSASSSVVYIPRYGAVSYV